MTKNISIDPSQNIFANDACFNLVSKEEVLFRGMMVTTLTYRNTQSLIWKIGQVALAVLITLATLGLAVCFQKGMIWRQALAQFKDRIVHQNVPVQHPLHAITPFSSKPLQIAGTTPNPAPSPIVAVPPPSSPITVVNIPPAPIPVSIPLSAPAPSITSTPAPVVPIAPPAPPSLLSPGEIALQAKKESILKENPEYGDAVQAWEKANKSLKIQVERLEMLRHYAFGTDKWVKHFGEIIGPVPPLPASIFHRCDIQDPSQPGKKLKVKDTHVLVLIPQAIMLNGNRVDISLKSLGEIVKNPKGGGHPTEYSGFSTSGFKYSPALGYENRPVAKSYWALMRKEILPGSSPQDYGSDPVDTVNEYNSTTGTNYSTPSAMDAVACCFMHFVSTGELLFDKTAIRCQAECPEKYPSVGPYSSSGLFVGSGFNSLDGVGGLWRF